MNAKDVVLGVVSALFGVGLVVCIGKCIFGEDRSKQEPKENSSKFLGIDAGQPLPNNVEEESETTSRSAESIIETSVPVFQVSSSGRALSGGVEENARTPEGIDLTATNLGGFDVGQPLPNDVVEQQVNALKDALQDKLTGKIKDLSPLKEEMDRYPLLSWQAKLEAFKQLNFGSCMSSDGVVGTYSRDLDNEELWELTEAFLEKIGMTGYASYQRLKFLRDLATDNFDGKDIEEVWSRTVEALQELSKTSYLFGDCGPRNINENLDTDVTYVTNLINNKRICKGLVRLIFSRGESELREGFIFDNSGPVYIHDLYYSVPRLYDANLMKATKGWHMLRLAVFAQFGGPFGSPYNEALFPEHKDKEYEGYNCWREYAQIYSVLKKEFGCKDDKEFIGENSWIVRCLLLGEGNYFHLDRKAVSLVRDFHLCGKNLVNALIRSELELGDRLKLYDSPGKTRDLDLTGDALAALRNEGLIRLVEMFEEAANEVETSGLTREDKQQMDALKNALQDKLTGRIGDLSPLKEEMNRYPSLSWQMKLEVFRQLNFDSCEGVRNEVIKAYVRNLDDDELCGLTDVFLRRKGFEENYVLCEQLKFLRDLATDNFNGKSIKELGDRAVLALQELSKTKDLFEDLGPGDVNEDLKTNVTYVNNLINNKRICKGLVRLIFSCGDIEVEDENGEISFTGSQNLISYVYDLYRYEIRRAPVEATKGYNILRMAIFAQCGEIFLPYEKAPLEGMFEGNYSASRIYAQIHSVLKEEFGCKDDKEFMGENSWIVEVLREGEARAIEETARGVRDTLWLHGRNALKSLIVHRLCCKLHSGNGLSSSLSSLYEGVRILEGYEPGDISGLKLYDSSGEARDLKLYEVDDPLEVLRNEGLTRLVEIFEEAARVFE